MQHVPVYGQGVGRAGRLRHPLQENSGKTASSSARWQKTETHNWSWEISLRSIGTGLFDRSSAINQAAATVKLNPSTESAHAAATETVPRRQRSVNAKKFEQYD